MKIKLERNGKRKELIRRIGKLFGLGLAGYVFAHNLKDMIRYIKIVRM